jgi:hypothetical protein
MNLWFALGLASLAAACTEVNQNFPEGGCVPGSYRCTGQTLERCTDDGASYAFFKECAEGSACTTEAPFCEGSGGTCASDEECAESLGDVGQCHVASCVSGQCQVTPAETGWMCDDQNACTEADACNAGVCIGQLITCNDDNPCTRDYCDAAEGCSVELLENAPCDDEKPCTVDDRCDAEATCAGTEKVCDDENPCTESTCDQISGDCISTAKAGACDDGNPCTDNDQCVAGACKGQPGFPCSEDSDCTTCGGMDACGGTAICVNNFCEIDQTTAFQCPQDGLGPCQSAVCVDVEGEPTCQTLSKEDGTVCSDGSTCTTGDVCASGACMGTVDPSVPGCGAYRIGWYVLSAGFGTMSDDQYQLEATAGAPTVFGTAVGDTYRVEAVDITPKGGAQ